MKYALEAIGNEEADPFFEELDTNSVGKIEWKDFFSILSK